MYFEYQTLRCHRLLTLSNSMHNVCLFLASLMVIATPFGALTSGPLMDMWGRRALCILTCFPLVVAWFLMAFCPDSVWFLYASRILSGFGAGNTKFYLLFNINLHTWCIL